MDGPSAIDEEILFRLHFEESEPLEAAFSRVAESDDVGSCIIEPDPMQLFFVASAPIGASLVEEIYSRGGLRWCSRHSVRAFR